MNRAFTHPVFASDPIFEANDVQPALSATEVSGVRMLLEREQRRQTLARSGDLGEDVRVSALDQARFAERIYQARRARERVFANDIFADPAWDILLDLFVRSTRNELISISSACYGANVPHATALRYVKALTKSKYLERISHPNDKRSKILKMTSLGNKLMGEWLRNSRGLC
jgi:predicted transcriptional regulator